MPVTTFEKIYDRATREGVLGQKSTQSIDWFRTVIRKNFSTVSSDKII